MPNLNYCPKCRGLLTAAPHPRKPGRWIDHCALCDFVRTRREPPLNIVLRAAGAQPLPGME